MTVIPGTGGTALALLGPDPTAADFDQLHALLPSMDLDALAAVCREADAYDDRHLAETWFVRAHALWVVRQTRAWTQLSWTEACRPFRVSGNYGRQLARAWDVFGVFAREHAGLPVRFYQECLAAGNPEEAREALGAAGARRRDDPGYTGDDLRRDLKAAKAPRPKTPAAAAVVERVAVPGAVAMRQLLTAVSAVRPLRRYMVERVALVLGADDGWPAVVALAHWILNVEAARQELARPQPAVALPGQADVAD